MTKITDFRFKNLLHRELNEMNRLKKHPIRSVLLIGCFFQQLVYLVKTEILLSSYFSRDKSRDSAKLAATVLIKRAAGQMIHVYCHLPV